MLSPNGGFVPDYTILPTRRQPPAGFFSTLLEAHPIVQRLGDSGMAEHMGPHLFAKTDTLIGVTDYPRDCRSAKLSPVKATEDVVRAQPHVLLYFQSLLQVSLAGRDEYDHVQFVSLAEHCGHSPPKVQSLHLQTGQLNVSDASEVENLLPTESISRSSSST